MNKLYTLFFLLLAHSTCFSQDYALLGTDPSGDCTSTCPDISELHFAYDIGMDSAWFKVVTHNVRNTGDAIFIHIDWDDDPNNDTSWTGGSYYLSFNQNRQINAWYDLTYSNVETFPKSGGGDIISYDVVVKVIDDYTTEINCKLSEVDSFTDGGIKVAASVGTQLYTCTI